MTKRCEGTAARLVAAATGAWGLALVLRPDEVLALAVPRAGRPPRRLVRVLGLRYCVQAAVVLAAPARSTVGLAAGADALHALSMVAAAVHWPRHRRATALSAGVATAAATAEVLTVPDRRSRRQTGRR
jgi:hypothetical protein